MAERKLSCAARYNPYRVDGVRVGVVPGVALVLVALADPRL